MRSAPFALALLGLAVPAAAVAQADDPAAQVVQRFDDALLATMKQGKALGFEGRYRKLEPAVKQAFDLPIMVRFAVGPTWSTLSAADQASLLQAFTRFSVSSWAKNFDNYDGQKFVITKVESRGSLKLVRTQLVSASGSAVDLVYRMQPSNSGTWKILDVYFNGSISQLSQQRADFASTLASGGAPALVKKLDALSEKQAKGG